MAAMRLLVLVAAGLGLGACARMGYSIPTPTYALVKDPAPYRTGSDGLRVDNAGVQLDQAGYRVDKQGQEIGIIDIEANNRANPPSNPMAGFYISSTGTKAGGSVMAPIEGAGAGAGYGPGSANPMPSGMEAPPPETRPKP